MFAVDLAYDGGRGSDGFITYIYGLSRLNVCQTVVVDDLEDISLIKSRNCLCRLVVIDKNQLLVACLQQVIAGQGADYLIVLIEGTQLLYLGNDDTIRFAFNVEPKDNQVWLPGVMSRKKQIIPMLTALWG